MVSNLLRRPRPTVQIGTQTRILAVTLDDVMRRPDRRGFVPAAGARRRIQALLAMGWPHRIITEHMTGVGQTSAVALHQRGKWIARATHDAVVVAYDALSMRSEEHTSELQSRENLVCRLLLEKKKTNIDYLNKCYQYIIYFCCYYITIFVNNI